MISPLRAEALDASLMVAYSSFMHDLCFRFVSPSRFLVSMYARPLALLDLISMKSAGKY